LKKREKKKRKKKKAPKAFSNKGEVNILRGEKHFNIKIFFLMCFHFLPFHHTISKKPSKIIENISYLFLDHLLAWRYTKLELYPFSLPMSSTYLAFRG
jgi:hypothetical protein